MRNLVTHYSFENGTRTIHIPLSEMTGVENIRLIVNETQKFVICSSMQKDLITSCVADAVNGGWNVTYASTLPALATGDKLTVEIDLGEGYYIDGTDWVLKAKVADEPFDIGEQLGNKIADILNEGGNCTSLFQGVKVRTVVIRKTVYPNPQASANGVLYGAFRYCKSLVSVDLSGLVATGGAYGLRDAFKDSTLESVDLSNLEYCLDNGLNSAFYGTNIRTLSLPKLKPASWIYGSLGSYGLDSMCQNCVHLESVSIPNLALKARFQATPFAGCVSLRTVECHPLLLGYNANASLLGADGLPVETIILTATASDDIYLTKLPNLTAETVKHILTQCANANMSGKTISFYSNGLTVQDDAQGSIQALYDSVVNTYGATIANLTITPYSA